MRLPRQLEKLARLFPADTPLYLVGGAVRDALLGGQSVDFDIASSLTTAEVRKLLLGTCFEATGEYPRTGTLVIIESMLSMEYTTFREDSYPLGRGDHSPINVAFSGDINVDARRRDFTCNAVYYNIVSKEYVDPTNGMADIKAKLLRTTRQPHLTLGEDALRIMRLARFATQLGFDVDPAAFDIAKSNSHLLCNIAMERITGELFKILNHESVGYSACKPRSVAEGINILRELDIDKYIFKTRISDIDVKRLSKLSKDGIYCCGVSAYLACLMLDMASDIFLSTIKMLVLPKALANDVISIREGYYAIFESGDLCYNSLKLLVAKYHDVIYLIIALGLTCDKDCESIQEATFIFDTLGLPQNVAMLKVSGRHLLERGVTGKDIGAILDKLFLFAIDKELNTQDTQLSMLTKLIGGNII